MHVGKRISLWLQGLKNALKKLAARFKKRKSQPQSRPILVQTLRICSFAGFLVAVDQLCLENPLICSCRCWAYLGLVVGLVSFAGSRYFQHADVAHRSRLEDKNEVEASIVEARTVELRLFEPRRPETFEEKKKQLNTEIKRLKKIGKENWTEYQILSLNQMLVDFRKPSDLICTADSVLDDLEEYAGDSRYLYNREYYAKWQKRVDEAKEEIGNEKDATSKQIDDKCEKLRAVLKTLYEHVTDFAYKWAKGSTLIQELLVVNAMAIPVFFTLGLVPVIHPSDPGTLGVINWAMLGVTGALAGSLRSLHRSDEVEVGDTRGKQEIWRTVSGATLGFVAGALTYGVIAGGLISGVAVPSIGATPLPVSDVGLSVVWGVAAGFSFERVFERVRTTTEAMG